LEAKIETDWEERKAERKAYQGELKKMMEGMLRDKQDIRMAKNRRPPAKKQQRPIQKSWRPASRRLNQNQEWCSP
jgi:hypothetical protein